MKLPYRDNARNISTISEEMIQKRGIRLLKKLLTVNYQLLIVHSALCIVHCTLCIVHCALLTDLHFHSLHELLCLDHQLVHVAVVLDKGNGLAETGDKFLDEG